MILGAVFCLINNDKGFKDMAILQLKDFAAGKVASTGPYAGMTRQQIVQAKIDDGKPFKLGSSGTQGTVKGISFNPNPTSLEFTYEKGSGLKKERITAKITSSKANIFKDEDFGGGGGAGGGTLQTAWAESAQCVWLVACLKSPNKKRKDFSEKDLKAAYNDTRCQVGSTKFEQIISLGPDWHESGYLTAKKLIDSKLVNNNQVFHRDSTAMKQVYKNKKVAFKNSNLSELKDDKWNPGDFWAIENNFDLNKMDTSSIKAYNQELMQGFKDKKIVGISLKKVNKNAKVSILNETDERPQGLKYEKGILATDRGSFFTSKGGFIMFSGITPGISKMEIRTNSALSTHKVEIILKTARGGGAGWGIIMDIIKDVNGVSLPDNRKIILESTKIVNGDSAAINSFWEKVKDSGGYDASKKDEFVEELKLKDKIWIHGKMGVVELIYQLEKTTKKKADTIVNKINNYAGSVSDLSSVYVKVYE